jgi:MerR family mercuric resistance operon transcriptional regulator
VPPARAGVPQARTKNQSPDVRLQRPAVYGGAQVRTLSFVRRARELGFTLDQVRELLRLVDRGYGCGEVRDLTRNHIADISAKIVDLRRIERLLKETSGQCAGGKVPACPIVDALFGNR